jgi:two-component sensor histidine kinase
MARALNRRDEHDGFAPEGRYEALFNNMAEGFVLCEAIRDRQGRLLDYWVRAANPVFVKRAPTDLGTVGRRQLEIRPDTPEPWFHACERALAGEPVRFEFRERRNGRWYDVHMTRLSENEFGQFFVDITERKAAEKRQAELFEELNHRVKNNLAVVSSILELQGRESPSEVREHLAKAVDRIRSIADLHTALYQQKSSETVALCPYLEDLGLRLSASLFDHGQGEVAVRCDPLEVPVKDAVSLGLIVNELVTNAAKHAIKEGTGTRIEVSVTEEGEELRVIVADDGPGFSGEVIVGGGLGLRVVRSLVEGLGGRVQVLDGPGGRVEVRAPIARVHCPAESQPALL